MFTLELKIIITQNICNFKKGVGVNTQCGTS